MPEQLEVEVEGEKLTLRRYQPGDRLRRVEAAEALTALGYPASYTMLANWAVQRIGPPYKSLESTRSTSTTILSRGQTPD